MEQGSDMKMLRSIKTAATNTVQKHFRMIKDPEKAKSEFVILREIFGTPMKKKELEDFGVDTDKYYKSKNIDKAKPVEESKPSEKKPPEPVKDVPNVEKYVPEGVDDVDTSDEAIAKRFDEAKEREKKLSEGK